MADKKSTVARRHTAVMESFFSTVKIELADRFASRSEPKMELSIIEVFDNQRAGIRRSARSVRRRTTRSGRVLFVVGRLAND